jgi:hypothetical protein
MLSKFSEFIDRASEFLAIRKGLAPTIGIFLILVNLVLQFFPGLGWLATSQLFLHLGVILAIIGIMLAWAL